MYIKIYFNDKPLFLCDELNDEINAYAHHDDAIFMDEFSNPSINSIIHEMRQEKVHAGIFLHKDLAALKKAFWKKFQVLQAAGGLVQNDAGEMLFMFRRGKWDLPKGKLDKGETLEQCAVREVREETGLKNIVLGEALLVTYHTYDESGKHFLKESHWYHMRAPGHQSLVPQQEEQITELKWVPVAAGAEEGAGADGARVGTAAGAMKKYMANTFPSIIDVLNAAAVNAAR